MSLLVINGEDLKMEGERIVPNAEDVRSEMFYCMTEEETVGQRGSCSQAHTQDSGHTLKLITSLGEGS